MAGQAAAGRRVWLGIQELQLCPAAGGTGAYGRASHIPPMQGAGSSDSPISPLRPTSDCTPPHSVRADQPAGQELLKDGARVQSPRLGASWGLKGETSAEAAGVQQRGLHRVLEEVLQVHRPAGETATIPSEQHQGLWSMSIKELKTLKMSENSSKSKGFQEA